MLSAEMTSEKSHQMIGKNNAGVILNKYQKCKMQGKGVESITNKGDYRNPAVESAQCTRIPESIKRTGPG